MLIRWLFLMLILVALGYALWQGFASSPGLETDLGSVAQAYLERSVPETGAPNVIAAVNFDFRAFDTLGEASILLTAVTGVLALLRGYIQRRRETGRA